MQSPDTRPQRRPGITPGTRLKDDLRRRCLLRVTAQRAALIAQSRQTGDAAAACRGILAEELHQALNAGTSGASRQPSSWSEADEVRLQAQLGQEGYLELMAAAEEALLNEMRKDLEMIGDTHGAAAGEYEALLEAEEQLLAAQAAGGPGAGDDVLCPLCVRSSLVLAADGFVCCVDGCGLRLDARGATAPPLELLRDRMCSLLTEHGLHCNGKACCRLPQGPAEQQELGSLIFSCATCGIGARVV